jgi:nucleotide-binding universal stress UspA family protein
MKVILSADGRDEAQAARRWCREHLGPGDEVIAVLGVDAFSEIMLSMSPLLEVTEPASMEAAARDRVTKDLAAAGIRCESRLANRSQARAVLDTAASERADLIVLGKRPHGAVADVLANETAVHVVHRPPCPVVVVPTDVEPHHGHATPGAEVLAG